MVTAGALVAGRVGVIAGAGLALVAVGTEAALVATGVPVVALGWRRGVAEVPATADIVPATWVSCASSASRVAVAAGSGAGGAAERLQAAKASRISSQE